MNKLLFYAPLGLSFLFFIVYILLAANTNFISVEAGYAIGEVSRWCERISDSYFREQSNALSNIGFMTTGLIMFWILARETRISGSRFHGSAPTAILYAATAWFLGPGSF